MGKGGLAENIAPHVLRRRKRLSFFFKLAAVHKFGCCVVSLLIAQFPADPPGGGGGGNYRPRNCHNTRRFYTHFEHSPKTDVQQLYCRLFEIRRKQTNGIMVLLGKHPTYHFKAFPLFTQSIFPYPFSRVGGGEGGERERATHA